MVRGLAIGLILLLSACALGEQAPPTPPPAITLLPPPAVQFEGTCSDTKALENWLQITTGLAADFLAQLNAAAALPQAEVHDEVLALADLRDAAHAAVTPDCAVAASLILTDAMNQAVGIFQAYSNGTISDLGNIVAETNMRIEEAMAIQNELILRMETQFGQTSGQPTATPSS